MNAPDSIARRLHAAGVGTYSPDDALPKDVTPITLLGWPARHDIAVAVATYAGGPEPDTWNGTEYPRLQVKTRAHDPRDAIALDRACYQALAFRPGDNPIVLDDGTTLTDCYALQSSPEPLGRDENGRWEFSRNYQLTIEP